MRPPALIAPAVRGRVDAAGQARDDREARPRQRGGQPLGHPGTVRRAPPRADHGDRELVARLERPLDNKAGRADRGCSRAPAGNPASPRAMTRTSAGRQSASSAPGVEVAPGCAILSASLGPTPATVARACPVTPPERGRPTRTARGGPGWSAARRPGPSSDGSGRAVAHRRRFGQATRPSARSAVEFGTRWSDDREHGPDVVFAGALGQLDPADRRAAGRNGSRPRWFFLSRPMASSSASGSRPGSRGRQARTARAAAPGGRPLRARSSPAARPAGSRRPCRRRRPRRAGMRRHSRRPPRSRGRSCGRS